MPLDQGADNSYRVKVMVTDGTLLDGFFVVVYVNDVDEKPIDLTPPVPLALRVLSKVVQVGEEFDYSLQSLGFQLSER